MIRLLHHHHLITQVFRAFLTKNLGGKGLDHQGVFRILLVMSSIATASQLGEPLGKTVALERVGTSGLGERDGFWLYTILSRVFAPSGGHSHGPNPNLLFRVRVKLVYSGPAHFAGF